MSSKSKVLSVLMEEDQDHRYDAQVEIVARVLLEKPDPDECRRRTKWNHTKKLSWVCLGQAMS